MSLRRNIFWIALSATLGTLGLVGLAYDWPGVLNLGLFLLCGLFFALGAIRIKEYRERIFYAKAWLIEIYKANLDSDYYLDRDMLLKQPAEISQLYYAVRGVQDSFQQKIEEEKSLRALQESILEGLNEGVIYADRQGQIIIETGLVKTLLRRYSAKRPAHPDDGIPVSADEVLDNYIFLRGVNYNHVWSLMLRAMHDETSFTQEISLAGPGEPRILEVYVKTLSYGSTQGALAVLRDVSHVKQLEKIREDFVANVTHELKTPLTSIKGYIDLLRSKRRDPEEADQFYEIIDIEADRLQDLISDLLELSAIQAGDKHSPRRERVYLYPIVDEIFMNLCPLARKSDIHFHLDVDPDFYLMATEGRLNQLMTNLISNAVKYNKPGGDVWVETKKERNRSIIVVRDNGIGIPEEDKARIFERFYRVSKSRSRELGGTGLGLAIVKHIASLYGGSVRVYSELGKGTSFYVIFPEETE
jgi:two-component system phosphate regulon sensor histidine kinase PhoR